MKAKGLAMRNMKPTTVILAFAFMSIVSAKAITTASVHMSGKPSAEAELIALRTTKPVIIEDQALSAALSGEHIETRRLILTAMSQETEIPKTSSPKKAEAPAIRMSKPMMVADAGPAPAATASPAASVVNKSAKEQTFAVDSGAAEKVYTVAPGATVVLEACASGCTATGPWGYSRFIKAGEVVETTGVSDVTTAKPVKFAAAKSAPKKAAVTAASPAKKSASAAAPQKTKSAKAKTAKAKHHTGKSHHAKHKADGYNPYFKGSFMSLFTGIVR